MDATAPTAKTPSRCECSRFSVLVNVHENDTDGDLTWDDEYSTGCFASTNNTFAPGHDAKLKSFLIRAGSMSHEVTKDEGGMNRNADAMAFANEFGFGYMVSNGIAAAKDKLVRQAEAAARKHERAEEREARKLAKRSTIIEVEGFRVNAKGVKAYAAIRKVGRWDYEGLVAMHRVEGGHASDTVEIFTYVDKQGKTQRTTKSR